MAMSGTTCAAPLPIAEFTDEQAERGGGRGSVRCETTLHSDLGRTRSEYFPRS
jgi:hypothetical protein